MTDKSRSATAYDKLSSLTAQATLAAVIAYDWTKLCRALDQLAADRMLDEGASKELTVGIEEMRTFAKKERALAQKLAQGFDRKVGILNEQIQNGVFNDEQEA